MKTLQLLAIGFASVLLMELPAAAIAPPYETDAELAKCPVIVIASWDKAEIKRHTLVNGNVLEKYEAFTELNVQRVIKGNIKPGKHTILLGFGIEWQQDGSRLATGTSTELPGDVDNVCKHNIWFLSRERSWDQADKTVYLKVPNYRAVQPPGLEEYFAALGSPKPEAAAKLLSSNDPEVLRRVLRYVCGDVMPWPYGESFLAMYTNPAQQGKVLKDQAQAVKSVIARDVPAGIRPMATAVYAFLAGKGGVEYLRSLLKDKDPDVRAVATGVLATQRDTASIEPMVAAAGSVNDACVACEMIDAVMAWGDIRLARVLIPLLQDDGFAYMSGDDLGIPALKARQGLHKLTGHWFPYDVDAAAQVWKQADAVADAGKRKELLDTLLPDAECPIVAEMVGSSRYVQGKAPAEPATQGGPTTAPLSDGHGAEKIPVATVRLKNTSSRPVTVVISPDVSMSWPSGSSYYSDGNSIRYSDTRPSSEDFVTLKPGGTEDLQVRLDGSFLLANPKDRTLTLTFGQIGSDLGLKGWIGQVHAVFGNEWKQERRPEKTQEHLLNGDLK